MKTKTIRFFWVSLVVFISVAAFSSCTSAKTGGEFIPTVDIRLMTLDGMKLEGGSTFAENPYIAPEGMMKGKPNEFVVLKIDASLATPSLVEIQASVLGAEGASVAVLYSMEDMKTHWEGWPAKEAEVLRRADRLDRTYLPKLITKMPRGKTTWYLVFVGKNPIPRPAKVFAKSFIGNGAPQTFEYELPPLPVKK